MGEDLLYSIKDVYLSYDSGPMVVDIPAPGVSFYRNSIHFIIGPSGIGKSTFLETLGLMTQTLHLRPGGEAKMTDTEGHEHSFSSIWSARDRFRSDFRKRHFSFLFQNNFLMPNFTVAENMALTYLMKSRDSDSLAIALDNYMDKVHLSKGLKERPVSSLSGGQRQRVAFLRALMAAYEILFADEPTGNLDPFTANQLLYILRDELKSSNKTAFLISHDIRLAMQYGDVIVCMVPSANEGHKHGVVRSDHIFKKKNELWLDSNNQVIGNLEHKLNQLYAI